MTGIRSSASIAEGGGISCRLRRPPTGDWIGQHVLSLNGFHGYSVWSSSAGRRRLSEMVRWPRHRWGLVYRGRGCRDRIHRIFRARDGDQYARELPSAVVDARTWRVHVASRWSGS